jgi:hypothetical protein
LLADNVYKNISDIPWAIMLQDEYFRPIEDEDRYYYISADFWQTIPDDSTGIMQLDTNITNIVLERCDLTVHFGKYRDYFATVPFLEHHYCPVIGQSNITLYGSFGNIKRYSLLETWLKRCDNTTRINKRTKCFSEEKMNANLKRTFLSYKFLDYAIDHTNIDDPSSMYMRSEAIPINANLYKRSWYLYNFVNYTTDAGLIFEENVSQIFSQVSDSKEQIDIVDEGDEKGSFSQLTIGMDKSMGSYKRQYIKGQQTLANVGGLTKGLLVIAAFINYLLSQELYYFELIRSIFTEFNTEGKKVYFKAVDNYTSSLFTDVRYYFFI